MSQQEEKVRLEKVCLRREQEGSLRRVSDKNKWTRNLQIIEGPEKLIKGYKCG